MEDDLVEYMSEDASGVVHGVLDGDLLDGDLLDGNLLYSLDDNGSPDTDVVVTAGASWGGGVDVVIVLDFFRDVDLWLFFDIDLRLLEASLRSFSRAFSSLRRWLSSFCLCSSRALALILGCLRPGRMVLLALEEVPKIL